MPAISLSLHVANAGVFSIQIGERTTFDALWPNLRTLTPQFEPVRNEAVGLIVAHPIATLAATLHELGLRSGDRVLIFPSETTPTNVTLGAIQGMGVLYLTLPNAYETLLVSDDIPLTEILPYLIQHSPPLSGYSPERLLVAYGRDLIDWSRRPSEANLKRGDVFAIMSPAPLTVPSILRLISPRDGHPPITVTTSPTVIGRYDQGLNTPLDIDLTTILPAKRAAYVASRQAIFTESGGVWRVTLHPEARVPAFVDNRRLSPDRPILLNENNVLSFGFSPNRPAAQFIVELGIT